MSDPPVIDDPGIEYIYSRLRKSPQQPRSANALPADLQRHTRCEVQQLVNRSELVGASWLECAMTRTLSEAEAQRLIASGKIGRLGCVDNGEPYVVPVNYLFEDGSIYSHSLPGRKIHAMRTQSRVCLQVDEIASDFVWRSVIAFGNFEEIRVPSDRRSIMSKLLVRFPLLTPVESVMARDASAPDSIAFRIIVDRLTGVEEG